MIYLDQSTLQRVRLPSGREIVQADGIDHRVIAMIETLASGRPLLTHVRVYRNGRLDHPCSELEEARSEMLEVMGCRPRSW